MNFLKLQQWSSASNNRGQILASDGFETGGAAAWWTESAPLAANYSPNTAEIPYQTSIKKNGTYAAHYFIRAAGPNEQEPLKFNLYGAGLYSKIGTLYEFFVEWYDYFATGYSFPTGSQKLMRTGYFDSNEPGTPVGGNSQDWFTDCLLSASNTYVTWAFFKPGVGGPGAGGEATYTPAYSIPTNTWVKFGAHIKIPSVNGGSDGIFKLYKDGVEFAGGSGLSLATGAARRPVNTIWVGGNFSMSPDASPGGDGHRYIDDIKIYNGLPY